MSKRKYKKRSDYWKKFEKSDPNVLQQHLQTENTEPISSGEPYYLESTASYSRAGPSADSTVSRRNAIHKNDKDFKYANIASGLLPYSYSADGVDVRKAIELCQKAYANVSVFRNAVDVMSEFANSNLYLEGGTKKSRDFIYKWFEKINLWNLKDQYFREYYEHYFKHPSGGEINLSIRSIINNFIGSEVVEWGIADFLRVMIAPLLFIYIVYSTKEMPLIHKLGKLQIILPLMSIYLWFWLLSPAKSIIYSGLFTTFVLIFNSYFLLFGKFTNKFLFVTSLIIYSFFLSSIYLMGLYLFLLTFILIYNNSKIGKVTLLFSLVALMSLNQLNVINEVRRLDTFEISIKSCKNSLETTDCLDDYYGK